MSRRQTGGGGYSGEISENLWLRPPRISRRGERNILTRGWAIGESGCAFPFRRGWDGGAVVGKLLRFTNVSLTG